MLPIKFTFLLFSLTDNPMKFIFISFIPATSISTVYHPALPKHIFSNKLLWKQNISRETRRIRNCLCILKSNHFINCIFGYHQWLHLKKLEKKIAKPVYFHYRRLGLPLSIAPIVSNPSKKIRILKYSLWHECMIQSIGGSKWKHTMFRIVQTWMEKYLI